MGGGLRGVSQCAATCGDGIRSASEVCDDGNQRDGDGCAADCQSIEAGKGLP